MVVTHCYRLVSLDYISRYIKAKCLLSFVVLLLAISAHLASPSGDGPYEYATAIVTPSRTAKKAITTRSSRADRLPSPDYVRRGAATDSFDGTRQKGVGWEGGGGGRAVTPTHPGDEEGLGGEEEEELVEEMEQQRHHVVACDTQRRPPHDSYTS